MEKFIYSVDKLSEITGKAFSWLVVIMALTMFSVVVLRYGFDLGWIAMQESVTFMHAIFFLIGITYTQKHHGHVRVDIFYQNFSPKAQAIVDLVGTLFLLIPVCILIFWVSLDYVTFSWEISEKSNQTGGLPGVFIIKTFMLIMPVLLALQGLAQSIKALLWLTGRIPEAGEWK
jgi:TRAP-type mannitol/chloroaromatic compound transport system permease small subunit